jgi:hypothetical protein
MPVKDAEKKVKIEISEKLAEELKEVLAGYKYANTPEDAIYDLLTFRSRTLKYRERYKENRRRKRLGEWRKFWVKDELEERLEEIEERMKDETEGWHALNRIEKNTHILQFLIKEHEELDAQRKLPIGGSIGPNNFGDSKRCPTCLAEVGTVWLDDKPVYEDGEPRIVALNHPDGLTEVARDLLEYVPENGYTLQSMDNKVMKSYRANGYEGDEMPPFFSETNLYELLGKDEARTLRGRLAALYERAGLKDLWYREA